MAAIPTPPSYQSKKRECASCELANGIIYPMVGQDVDIPKLDEGAGGCTIAAVDFVRISQESCLDKHQHTMYLVYPQSAKLPDGEKVSHGNNSVVLTCLVGNKTPLLENPGS